MVQKIGRDLGLSGSVENQEPYDVRIVAEGEEDVLKEFTEALRIKWGPIQVQQLEVSWTKATGEFPYFKILRGEWNEEMEEGLDVVAGLLRRSIKANEEYLVEARRILGEEDRMIDLEDRIREKKDV